MKWFDGTTVVDHYCAAVLFRENPDYYQVPTHLHNNLQMI